MLQLPVWIVTVILAALALVGRVGGEPIRGEGGTRSATAGAGKAHLPLRQALGQMIVARFHGTEPPAAFLQRIEAGEIGGVILFADNLTGSEAATELRIERLRRAASAGGNPPPLVMVDQEGGEVRRLDGPPSAAPARMTGRRDAREQGEATAALLRRLGIDVDLAPVADVGHQGSFLGPRAFGSTPEEVALRACAFADGLRHGGVIATLKHFPGLGFARVSTDTSPVTITAPGAKIRAGYAPYQTCVAAPLTLVMVSSAVYPHLTGSRPAVISPGTYARELAAAGARGAVTISDALETPALESQPRPARDAVTAGLDLLLYAESEATSAAAYAQLLTDLERGRIPAEKVREAAAAVLGLKWELRPGQTGREPSLPPASG